jgi:hypothetical protein
MHRPVRDPRDCSVQEELKAALSEKKQAAARAAAAAAAAAEERNALAAEVKRLQAAADAARGRDGSVADAAAPPAFSGDIAPQDARLTQARAGALSELASAMQPHCNGAPGERC